MVISNAGVKQFMSLLFDELKKDNWGDIDPWWLTLDTTDDDEYTEALEKAFINAFEKFTDENI